MRPPRHCDFFVCIRLGETSLSTVCIEGYGFVLEADQKRQWIHVTRTRIVTPSETFLSYVFVCRRDCGVDAWGGDVNHVRRRVTLETRTLDPGSWTPYPEHWTLDPGPCTLHHAP